MLSENEIKRQKSLLESEGNFVDIVAPATPENGITIIENQQKYIETYDNKSKNYSIEKFVPASGAATRMFKRLIAFNNEPNLKNLHDGGDYSVKATIDAYGQTVSGIFTFNNDYEMISFCTNDRAVVGADGTIEYIPWSAVCGDYKVGNDGIHRPSTFQAIWNYPDGDFVYFNGTIRSITSE